MKLHIWEVSGTYRFERSWDKEGGDWDIDFSCMTLAENDTDAAVSVQRFLKKEGYHGIGLTSIEKMDDTFMVNRE